MTIPSDYNIQKKATEKMSKYIDLQIEFQRLWNKKVEVIPVIIGATRIVDKNIKKYEPKCFLNNRTVFGKRDKLSTGYSWLHQVLKKIVFQAILYTHEVYQKMYI